eukprot:4884238-Pleurochrysis_carterae.AAC.2
MQSDTKLTHTHIWPLLHLHLITFEVPEESSESATRQRVSAKPGRATPETSAPLNGLADRSVTAIANWLAFF